MRGVQYVGVCICMGNIALAIDDINHVNVNFCHVVAAVSKAPLDSGITSSAKTDSTQDTGEYTHLTVQLLHGI